MRWSEFGKASHTLRGLPLILLRRLLEGGSSEEGGAGFHDSSGAPLGFLDSPTGVYI